MAKIEKLDFGVIEAISKILGDTSTGFTGTEIGKVLYESKIKDIDPINTKWKRLNSAIANKQEEDGCSNNVLNFIQLAMAPTKHLNNIEWFNDTRYKLNQALSFAGYTLNENGKISKVSKANTISEAAIRASKLQEHLKSRNTHPDIFIYCREELLVDNYFHTVFEATKSVADKIRLKTGLTSDGATLVQEAFSFKGIPYLALNSLQTDSEKSEQKGFINLLVGLFGTFRNTTAHAPKITWKIDEIDALDILSMVSLIHRRLDVAIEAKKMYENRI